MSRSCPSTDLEAPRGVPASRRAGRDRIAPLIASNPRPRTGLLGGFRAVGTDGAEVVGEAARDEAALDALQRLVMTSELLPGEDPALLTGPTRVERYAADDTFGPLAELLSETDR